MATDSKENITKREYYNRIYQTLWTEKASFDGQWRDLADFVKPGRLRQYVSNRNKGDRRNLKILDSSATFALRTLAAGMHSGMTNPGAEWFELSTPDPDLAKFRPVKEWLHDLTQRMLAVFLRTNLYTTLPTIYGDQGLFGTGSFALMEDEPDLLRAYPFPIGTYALGLSERQQVDTFVREYTMTVRQLVRRFGSYTASGQPDWSKFSQTVKNLWDRSQYEESIEVCWYVAPNVDADPDKLEARYLPWHSCHLEKGGEDAKVLSESGFNEFPIIAPRWEAAAEDVFGTECPGMVALGDIRQLQTMAKRKAQAVEKGVNPPVQAPTHMKAVGVNLLPGGVNYVDSLQQQQGIRPVHETRLDIDHMRLDIADVRNIVKTAFYEPLFLMLATADATTGGQQKTAREIEERHEEKLFAMGPVVERNGDECHGKVIDRTYAMMDRAGLIPPPPPDLEGKPLKVIYQSVMAKALRQLQANPLRNFLRETVPLLEFMPSMAYKLRPFKIVDRLGDAFGVPPDILADDEEAAAALQQQQAAEQRAQQAETAAMVAKASKDLGSPPTTEGVSQ